MKRKYNKKHKAVVLKTSNKIIELSEKIDTQCDKVIQSLENLEILQPKYENFCNGSGRNKKRK